MKNTELLPLSTMLKQQEIWKQIIAKQAEISDLIAQLQALNPDITPTQKKPSKRFEPPTLNEVSEYIALKGYQVDPIAYHAFYTSKNWMIGKNKMTSWRAALITWDRNSKQQIINKSSTNNTFFDGLNSQDF